MKLVIVHIYNLLADKYILNGFIRFVLLIILGWQKYPRIGS